MSQYKFAEPRIITRDAIHYIGIAKDFNVHEVATGEDDLGARIWSDFTPRVSEISERLGLLGISSAIRSGGMATYTAAAEVSKISKIPDGMMAGTLPAQKYVEFLHRGPISQFPHTVNFIHNEWMPQAGYKNHDCSQIEVYHDSTDVNSNEFEMKVIVPIGN